MSDFDFVRRVLIVFGIAAVAAALWMLSDVLLLAFAAVLVAFVITSLARPLLHLGFSRTFSVIVAFLGLALALAAFFTMFGADIIDQSNHIAQNVQRAWSAMSARLEAIGAEMLLKRVNPGNANLGQVLGTVLSWSVSVGQAVVAAVLVVVGGLYIALSGTAYRDGLVKLVPQTYHANIAATLDDICEALNRWIRGQLVVMLIVGVLTSMGLMLAGVNSALALGVLAGTANLVPYLGSIFAAAVTLIIASAQGQESFILAALVMLGVQQVESNIISPVILGRAVSIEPAVGMFALVAMGVLFGPLGILLGYPLTIVADIAIRRLYVRDALDENVDILGQPAQRSKDVDAKPAGERAGELPAKTGDG